MRKNLKLLFRIASHTEKDEISINLTKATKTCTVKTTKFAERN